AVETLTVRVELLAVSTALQDADTPGGMPSARRWTDPLNPLWGETVIENVPLPPRGIVADGGPAVRSNPGPVTVSITEAVCVRPPPAAITENVQRPVGVSFPRETVSTCTWALAPGANEAVAPGGSPLTLSATGSAKPYKPETVTVEVALAPCTALAEVALSAKSCTTSQKAALCVLPPPVPEMTAVS